MVEQCQRGKLTVVVYTAATEDFYGPVIPRLFKDINVVPLFRPAMQSVSFARREGRTMIRYEKSLQCFRPSRALLIDDTNFNCDPCTNQLVCPVYDGAEDDNYFVGLLDTLKDAMKELNLRPGHFDVRSVVRKITNSSYLPKEVPTEVCPFVNAGGWYHKLKTTT